MMNVGGTWECYVMVSLLTVIAIMVYSTSSYVLQCSPASNNKLSVTYIIIV